MRTIPRMFKISLFLVIAIGLALFAIFAFVKSLSEFVDMDIGMRLVMIFIILLPAYTSFIIFSKVKIGFCKITIQSDGISVFQPFRRINKFYNWDELKGYSKSRIDFGRKIWESESLVIYSKGNAVHEIIKSYNRKYEEACSELKISNLKYLGHEPDTNGWLTRKYAYR